MACRNEVLVTIQVYSYTHVVVRKEQLEQIALTRFADRLHEFITKRVHATPRPTREAVHQSVIQLNPVAVKAGFASQVDVALCVLAHFYLDGRDGRVPVREFILDSTVSPEEKRYQLSEALADAGVLPFGALEDDDSTES